MSLPSKRNYSVTDGLMYELDSKHMFDRDHYDSNKINSGVLSSLEAIKIQMIQNLLETTGTDSEWMMAMRINEFALIEYLLQFISKSANNNHCNASCKALAFAGNIYSSLYIDFIGDHEDCLHLILDTAGIALEYINKLLQAPKHEVEVSVEPYAGFDDRDIDEFNLQGEEYTTYMNSRNRPSSSHGLVGLESTSDEQASILLWSLLLYQFFAKEIYLLKDTIVMERLALEEDVIPADEAADTETTVFRNSYKVITELKSIAKTLLINAINVDQNVYEQFIKAVAAINVQFPPRQEAKMCSEIAELCASMEYNKDSSECANISEGLMHILNEVGYPNHAVPETLAVLKLCVDLTYVPGCNGFFYTNDVRVLVDVCIRELTNIHTNNDDNESLVSRIRVLYMQLIGALVCNTSWVSVVQSYRDDDIRDVLQLLAHDETSSIDDWAKEFALQTLELIEPIISITANTVAE